MKLPLTVISYLLKVIYIKIRPNWPMSISVIILNTETTPMVILENQLFEVAIKVHEALYKRLPKSALS